MTKYSLLLAAVVFTACSLKSIGRLKSPVEALANDSDALHDLGATAVLHNVFHSVRVGVSTESFEDRADAGSRYWVANKRVVAFSGAMAALADQEGPDAKSLAAAGFSVAEKAGTKVDVGDPVGKFFEKVTEAIVFGVKRNNLRDAVAGPGVDAACVLLAERQLLRDPLLDFGLAKSTFEQRLREQGAKCSNNDPKCPLVLDAVALSALGQQSRQIHELFASATGAGAALVVLHARRTDIGAPFKDQQLADDVDAAVACAREFPEFDVPGFKPPDGKCVEVLTQLNETFRAFRKTCP